MTLRKPKRAEFLCHVLFNYYRGEIESMLSEKIASRHHGICKAKDRKTLQRVIKILFRLIYLCVNVTLFFSVTE